MTPEEWAQEAVDTICRHWDIAPGASLVVQRKIKQDMERIIAQTIRDAGKEKEE